MIKTATYHSTDNSFTRLVVTITTHEEREKPYFSITADEYVRGRHQSCGCLHEEILKAFPDFQPLVDIHLSDLDGVPSHAEANGWHWLAKAAGIKEPYEPDQSPEECARIFGEHIRMDEEYVETFIAIMRQIYNGPMPENGLTSQAAARARWQEEIPFLRTVWKRQAEKALEFMKKLL